MTSTIAFQQILGRTCSIGNKIEPVIIDTSQSARKILLALLRENKEGKPFPFSTGNGNKEILHVGIGSVIQYDLDKVLHLMDPTYKKQEEIKKAAKQAVEKYHSFGGKDYDTYEDLANSGLDYKKFKACAELMKISTETAYQYQRG